MSEFIHIPVLADAVAQYLSPSSGRVYCDGTLGGAGHAHATLEQSGPDGRLIGIDRDRVALAAARQRLASYGDRVTFVHGRFGDVDAVLSELGLAQVDGFLLDVGPSSPQFDTPERGFSFQRAGPIDMRMNADEGESALDLIRRLGADELCDLIREYGEERYARRIALAIKEDEREDRLRTTLDLADSITAAIPMGARRRMRINPATKTFQALRIVVNHELDELAQFLDVFPGRLATGGRCVIISFHSLEDRMVKRRFRELAWSSSLPPDLAVKAGERVAPICRVLTRKPVFGTGDEIETNPRARSARLRACEKLPH